MLGVPVVVETKAGGSSTLTAGLTASKKPDGYTLGIVTSDAITRLPDLIKVPYDPIKDFTFMGQYVAGSPDWSSMPSHNQNDSGTYFICQSPSGFNLRVFGDQQS